MLCYSLVESFRIGVRKWAKTTAESMTRIRVLNILDLKFIDTSFDQTFLTINFTEFFRASSILILDVMVYIFARMHVVVVKITLPHSAHFFHCFWTYSIFLPNGLCTLPEESLLEDLEDHDIA